MCTRRLSPVILVLAVRGFSGREPPVARKGRVPHLSPSARADASASTHVPHVSYLCAHSQRFGLHAQLIRAKKGKEKNRKLSSSFPRCFVNVEAARCCHFAPEASICSSRRCVETAFYKNIHTEQKFKLPCSALEVLPNDRAVSSLYSLICAGIEWGMFRRRLVRCVREYRQCAAAPQPGLLLFTLAASSRL